MKFFCEAQSSHHGGLLQTWTHWWTDLWNVLFPPSCIWSNAWWTLVFPCSSLFVSSCWPIPLYLLCGLHLTTISNLQTLAKESSNDVVNSGVVACTSSSSASSSSSFSSLVWNFCQNASFVHRMDCIVFIGWRRSAVKLQAFQEITLAFLDCHVQSDWFQFLWIYNKGFY